ncbi:hypothetical protein KP509_03G093400 [Ceratopteris richardii]|uniref:Uncharacterized protein n=1 Tax=Ceratopteris richardii TaxID=49495 RepID=A0A8T2V9T8_CERRI|nr:hypothetical protein KP509_03G093400 [Ceratopteris richardii]
MASRLMASQASRYLLRRASQHLFSLASPAPAVRSRQITIPLFRSDELGRSSIIQCRMMNTNVSTLPDIADKNILHALKALMAVNWTEISDEAKDAVEAALTNSTSDNAGLEKLKDAWRAAEAVEKFSGTLVTLRMCLDDMSGLTGENVKPLPPLLLDALKTALSRYRNYLAAFKEDEFYLKKKVEVELGTLLVHIRQRCSGLDPEWGDISVIGTAGIAGSFIEYRAR